MVCRTIKSNLTLHYGSAQTEAGWLSDQPNAYIDRKIQQQVSRTAGEIVNQLGRFDESRSCFSDLWIRQIEWDLDGRSWAKGQPGMVARLEVILDDFGVGGELGSESGKVVCRHLGYQSITSNHSALLYYPDNPMGCALSRTGDPLGI